MAEKIKEIKIKRKKEKSTTAYIKEFRENIITYQNWTEKTLVKVYELQTNTEQSSFQTREINGVGFTAFDSSFGSFLATWILSGKKLTGKYLEAGRKIAKKYAKQMYLNFFSEFESLPKESVIPSPIIEKKESPKPKKIDNSKNPYPEAPVKFYEHQIHCLNFLKEKDFAALLMDMGTGKSITILTHVSRTTPEQTPSLIVTKNSIKYNWLDEIEKAGYKKEDAIILEGPTKKKIKLLKTKSPKFWVLNYESLRLLKEELLEAIKEGKIKSIILDESTSVKNPMAKMTKAILAIGDKVKYKYILTGTPVTNNPLDAFCQFRFLDPKILFFNNYYAFRAHYCQLVERNFGGQRFKEIVGYKNLDKLIRNITPHSFIIKKEDCLDLPPKTYETRTIEMTAEQKSIYKDLSESLIAEITGGAIVTQNVLTKLLRLQQLLGGTGVLEDGTLVPIKENKTVELLGTIEEIGKNKMIIWCRFVPEIKRLQKILIEKKYNVDVIHGAVKPEQRQDIVSRFNDKENELQIVIAQQQTAGFGLNLVGGNYAIYFSNDWSLQNRQQSEDRIYRIGQTEKTTIIDIVHKDTLEEMIIKSLRSKKDFQDIFFKNPSMTSLKGGLK